MRNLIHKVFLYPVNVYRMLRGAIIAEGRGFYIGECAPKISFIHPEHSLGFKTYFIVKLQKTIGKNMKRVV